MDTKEKCDTHSIVSKPEYASSEFSAEAPPAYKMKSANSVKIAKIIAFTIILSSFIFGSFMLASTYLQARATCDQVSALNTVLDKELMLEAMQQEQDLPRAEQLQSREVNNNFLQDLSKDEMNKPNKKDETNPDDVETVNSENSIDDESNDIMKRVRVKMPLDFDLTELAHNILMNNQKSRMNCVVERRRTEEIPENPFSAFLEEEKPKEKVTGERVSIFCETGEPKTETPIVHVQRIVLPFSEAFANPMSHRFGPPQMPLQVPPQFPPIRNQMNFLPQGSPQMTQIRLPFPVPPMSYQPQNFQQQAPPMPAQMMTPPRPEVPQFRLINPAPQQQQMPSIFERPQSESQESQPQPEVRIQLRRIQIPGSIKDIFPFLNNINNDMQRENTEPQRENNNIQIQQVPLAMALSKVGISPDDLMNIQRMAEEKFKQHIQELVAEEENDSSSGEPDSISDEMESSGEISSVQDSEGKLSTSHESLVFKKPEEQPEVSRIARANFGLVQQPR